MKQVWWYEVGLASQSSERSTLHIDDHKNEIIMEEEDNDDMR